MVEQTKAITNNTPTDDEAKRDNRIKATFSFLDHFVKIYNNSETYIKRCITLFGLGSIIAGTSFNMGQRLSLDRVATPQNSSNSNNLELSDSVKPPQSVRETPQPSQPQIIYVTPPPAQSLTVNNPEPLVITAPATSKTTTTTPQPEPVVVNAPVTSKTTTTTPQTEPVAANLPVNSLPITKELSQVEQQVNSVKEISGAISNIEQDLGFLFGEQED